MGAKQYEKNGKTYININGIDYRYGMSKSLNNGVFLIVLAHNTDTGYTILIRPRFRNDDDPNSRWGIFRNVGVDQKLAIHAYDKITMI